MAKKPVKRKGPINKKPIDLNAFKKKNQLNQNIADKEQEWIPLSQAFHEALGIPGVPKGGLSIFRGFSNTGKSTAVFEAMAACQKIGIIPVFIDTENSLNWEHLRTIGLEFEEVVDESTGEITYEGDFIYINNDTLLDKYGYYNYQEAKDKKEKRTEAVIEDVARIIDEMLVQQANGELPYELCFIWDSIGSLNCYKSYASKSSNNMWNAGALDVAFKSIVNHKIPSSTKIGKDYTNTFLCVQKIWIDSMQGAGVVKHKGGEAFYYPARLIVHLGGISSHGTAKLTASSGGKTYAFGISTKIKVVKNQVNGIEWEGKIASVPHGYINPDKKNDYTRDHKDYILDKLNLEFGEITVEEDTSETDVDDFMGA